MSVSLLAFQVLLRTRPLKKLSGSAIKVDFIVVKHFPPTFGLRKSQEEELRNGDQFQNTYSKKMSFNVREQQTCTVPLKDFHIVAFMPRFHW